MVSIATLLLSSFLGFFTSFFFIRTITTIQRYSLILKACPHLPPPPVALQTALKTVFSFICRLSVAETDREFHEHFLLLLLFSRLSGLHEPALQALPCSHPSLIKEFLHRYISPHRQCLFSRCCHVPFFALISSLKLFLIPVPPASLPSPSFVRAVICDSLLPGGTCGKRR